MDQGFDLVEVTGIPCWLAYSRRELRPPANFFKKAESLHGAMILMPGCSAWKATKDPSQHFLTKAVEEFRDRFSKRKSLYRLKAGISSLELNRTFRWERRRVK